MTSIEILSSNEASIRRSFRIQARVIHALIMREMITRYGRNNLGFLWMIITPMLFVSVITIPVSLSSQTKHALPFLPFALTGYSAVVVIRDIMINCSNAIGPNLPLLYHRNVTLYDVFYARTILDAASSTIAFIALLSPLVLFNWMAFPADILLMMSGWMMLIWHSFSVGLVAGVLGFRYESFSRLFRMALMLVFPFSGAMFMVSWLPSEYGQFMLWFPLVHGMEMMRGGYYGDRVIAQYSVTYIFMVNLAFSFIGYWSVKRAKGFLETR